MGTEQKLTSDQKKELLSKLKFRFAESMHRHEGLDWDKVQSRLKTNPEKLWALNEMESTGGEPDIVSFKDAHKDYIFVDYSPEGPKGRRSICYDREALEARKKFPPKNSATDVANEMGIELLSEDQYWELQTFGNFDTKTSSWIKTPDEVRGLGGALFCDRRYDKVFTYHNGADSYYAARGFRGLLYI